MKNKTKTRLTILTTAFLLFFALFLLRDNISALFSAKTTQPLSAIKPEDVTAITIQTDSKTNNLQMKNKQWIMIKDKIEYKADATRIQQALDTLLAIEKGDVVSTNKNKHKDLGIGPKKITLKAGNETKTIYVGNQRGSQSLVRLNDENDVFATTNLESIFIPDDYRNLALGLVQDESKVTAVSMNAQGQEIELVKNNDSWTVNGVEATPEQAGYYISDLKNLRANDATTDSTIRDSLAAPTTTLSVKEGNTERKATFYYKDETDMYATTSFSQLVYVIPISSVDAIKADQNYFIRSDENTTQ